MGEPVTKTLLTVKKTTTVTLEEDALRDILRKHFDMPDATMDFDIGYEDFFRSVTLTSVETEQTESPFDVRT